MLRVGLIGSQSMHAKAFAKVCNLPDEKGQYIFEDVRVNAICGIDDDLKHTKAVATEGNITYIVKTPDELFDKCDAVMVLTRRGEEHIPYALPFLKKSYPVFIDKPVCCNSVDIAILKSEIKKRKCILAGGSGLKYSHNLKEIKKILQSRELGRIVGASLNHNGDIKSIYGGIFFYVCHSVEMMLTLFGYEPVSVQTVVLEDTNFTVVVKYKDKLVNLIINNCFNNRFITIYGDAKTATWEIDSSDIFKESMRDFVHRIKTKKITTSVDRLVRHVYVIQAIENSIKENKEIENKFREKGV